VEVLERPQGVNTVVGIDGRLAFSKQVVFGACVHTKIIAQTLLSSQ